ncbi:MAG: ribosomal-processing cysteine protease Prp [Spirochaetales bacterium]|jgi:uncharacterized protein|nr:ribosomal-processing cysteine protease Prp [Spirochaetales bacterium]
MITVTVTIDEDGVMQSLSARGHSSKGKAGENIVCAAATVLMRTAARLLEKDADIVISGGADDRGSLDFVVETIGEGKSGLVTAVGEFLLQGISDLQQEHPRECALKLVKRNRS